MSDVAYVGDFCSNPACPDYGQLQSTPPKPNIKKTGKTPKGIQRYQCKTCGVTFTETKGTVFYRHRTPASEIIETLALIAEGGRISSLSRVKGHKEDTILDWLKAAAHHAEAIEEVLLMDYHLSRGQLDALWSDKAETAAHQDKAEIAHLDDTPRNASDNEAFLGVYFCLIVSALSSATKGKKRLS